MEKKELEAALVEHKGDIQKLLNAIEKSQGDDKLKLEKELKEANDTLVVMKKEIADSAELHKTMQKQLDDNSTEIAKAKKEPTKEELTFVGTLKKELDKEIDKLQGLKKGDHGDVRFMVKSFLETANASVTTGSLLPWPQRDPASVSKAPDRNTFMLDIISQGASTSLTVYWVQRKTRTDNTEWVAEGVSAASQTVLGYETKNATMQNLAEFIKVSNNSIDDIDWLMSEIQTELVTLFMLKLDADLLNGTTGANGFDGVNVLATAFSAGGDTMPSGVVPNKYDALTYAITQVEVAHFNPNYIVLHPADVRDMKLTRDDRGAYLVPPQVAENNPQVAGVRIIANTGVTKGSYLAGDFTKAKWWNRKGMELRVWEQNDTDVQAQLKTVTLYGRGTLVVKDADKLAFVKDTFADTITEITNS